MTATVLVATRSPHKLRELLQLLPPIPNLSLVSLLDLGIPPSPAEDEIEKYDSFEDNALAKARYFHRLSGLPVLADDSGLCVHALGGAPGVRSKRFAGRSDLSGTELDQENCRHLLEVLAGRDEPRTAYYVCVIALVSADGTESLFRGNFDGEIAHRPAGDAGFGYDPLFFVPSLNATVAQIPPEVKNRISHRRRAFEKAVPWLRLLAELSGTIPAPDYRRP